MKKCLCIIFLLIAFILPMKSNVTQRLRIVSYNVENLFDTKNDTLKNDEDFLPNSIRHWTYSRFRKKIYNISRVIASVGEFNPPFLVGLCEVENDYVLQTLVKYGPLKEIGYKYVHYESPDKRGIDVALLYLPEYFTPLISMPIEVDLPKGKSTRDLLYVCGELINGEKLHVFQIHFPSRAGGMQETEPNRLAVASTLRQNVDSIFQIDENASILIMGDFNDYPDNKSVIEVLGAIEFNDISSLNNTSLYNLASNLHRQGFGSYCMKGEWGMLDQIVVSGAMLHNENKKLFVDRALGMQLYHPQWMLKYDYNILDSVPLRTYSGLKYIGGYSDHLPIYLDIHLK